MRSIRLLVLALSTIGCGGGTPPNPARDGGPDAYVPSRDAGRDGGADAGSVTPDGGAGDGGSGDAGAADGGRDADTREDAGARDDAGTDAATVLDAGACGAIGAGHTITLDGAADPGEYPASQVLSPGAPISSADTFALTWDRDFLYLTVTSSVFEGEYKPLHVYVEAASALSAATSSNGKEYGGHTPRLPFAPTHVIAARRTSDSGDGGPYNGVYTAASSWTDRATPLALGSGYWVSGDARTISVQVPWTALGCPSALRLSAHVVNGAFTEEWKDLVPAGATPWEGDGGAYYEIDLSADPAISGWRLR